MFEILRVLQTDVMNQLESDVHLPVVAVRVELGHLDHGHPRPLEHLPRGWRGPLLHCLLQGGLANIYFEY